MTRTRTKQNKPEKHQRQRTTLNENDQPQQQRATHTAARSSSLHQKEAKRLSFFPTTGNGGRHASRRFSFSPQQRPLLVTSAADSDTARRFSFLRWKHSIILLPNDVQMEDGYRRGRPLSTQPAPYGHSQQHTNAPTPKRHSYRARMGAAVCACGLLRQWLVVGCGCVSARLCGDCVLWWLRQFETAHWPHSHSTSDQVPSSPVCQLSPNCSQLSVLCSKSTDSCERRAQVSTL